MKRIISLALSILMLGSLITGCERFSTTEQESRTPMFQPTSTPTTPPTSNETPTLTPKPAQTDSPADPTEGNTSPTEAPADLSSDLASLVSFTEFPDGNYLADPKFDTDEFLPDYDSDNAFLQPTSLNLVGVCTTEDTIYFFPGTRDGPAFLYFTDIASGVTLPLCNRPECNHNDDTCNAYLASTDHVFGLRIYDGHIYWLAYEQYELNLMCMNMDGTDHEVIFNLEYDICKDLRQLGNGLTWVIHRGYVYISGITRDRISDFEPIHFWVYAIPLTGEEVITVMSGTQEGRGAYCFLKPLGNDLYISIENYWKTDDGDSYEMGAFYRWNSKTRKGEYLYGEEKPSSECKTYFDFCSPHPVAGDGLYYTGGQDLDLLMKLSFQTGELEEIEKYPDKGMTGFTDDFIVLCDGYIVSVYDYDLNLLYRSEQDQGLITNFMGVGGGYAFYLYSGLEDMKAMAAVPLNGGDMLLLHKPVS